MKNSRILRRKQLAKTERKRVKRNKLRKRLRIASRYEVNLAIHKLKVKQGKAQGVGL